MATVLLLPSSACTLLSATRNPPSSSSSTFLRSIPIQKPPFFPLFYPKLPHAILSLLLALTSLSLAKASIVLASRQHHHRKQSSPTIPSFLHLYRPIALTELLNRFLILSTNAMFFLIALLLFDALESLGFDSRNLDRTISAVGIIFYSAIMANVSAVCDLASIVAAMENCRAGEAFAKASMLVRGRVAVALSLAVPTNLAMAAVESLFQVRVMRPYYQNDQFDPSLMCEGFTITYIYSIMIVLHIIITCSFYEFCKCDLYSNCEGQLDYEVGLGEGEEENGVLLV